MYYEVDFFLLVLNYKSNDFNYIYGGLLVLLFEERGFKKGGGFIKRGGGRFLYVFGRRWRNGNDWDFKEGLVLF